MSNEISLTALEDKFVLNDHGLSRRRPGLHPSSASVEYVKDGMQKIDGKCLREVWYRQMQYKKTNPSGPKLMHTAHLGKWDEVGLIDNWKSMGLWVGNNIKFYRQDLILSGEMDAVLRIDDKLIGYEIKTFYGYLAEKQIRGSKRPEVPGHPKENQILQALIYAWEYKNEFDQFRMFYLNRGDGSRYEFEVGCSATPSPDGTHRCWCRQIPGDYWNMFSKDITYLPYNIEDIHDRYKKLIKYIREETLPPTDFEEVFSPEKVEFLKSKGLIAKTKYEKWQKNPEKNPIGNWECSYCPMKSQCRTDCIKKVIKTGE
jgi:hypothetical protein